MKRTILTNLLVAGLISLVFVLNAEAVRAQSALPNFTVLHHFDLFTQGGQPFVSEALTLSGDTLYGSTYGGGANGKGVLFSVRTNGTAYNVIHAFSALGPNGTNGDGELPLGTLKFVGNKLYGTASSGGSAGNGVLYSLNPDGSNFTPLFNFSGAPLNSSYGKHSPFGEMVLSGETLYGVTSLGGNPTYDGSVNGKIFAFNTTSGNITFPYRFPDVVWDGVNLYTPYGPGPGLVLRDNKLYGITQSGGYDNNGTVFSVNTDGSGYTTLHYFTNPSVGGSHPYAPPVLVGDTLYGTTRDGGSQNRGVIFALNINGTGFTVLRNFNLTEGYSSQSGLLVSGDTLYGSTLYGGVTGWGTIFSMKTNGTAYTILHSLDRFVDGAAPTRLIQAGGTLYGMGGSGGMFDKGTIFKLTLPTNTAGFDFDGDGKTDVSVYRPSNGLWFVEHSGSGGQVLQLGNATDKIVPADFDGDGKTDIAVYRQSQGGWYIYNSATATYTTTQYGAAEDLPVPGDYDNDGKADLAVYRPSVGTWFVSYSGGGERIEQFGANGDVPAPGDYDGDGRNDFVVWRPSNGVWYERRSTAGDFAIQFGTATDKIAPADYDGDGKMDVAVYRPSQGTWYIVNSSNGGYPVEVFGLPTDIPTPGDYDGDGRADIAIFRPSNGQWWLNRTTSGLIVTQFGANGDTPTPNAFGN